VATSPSTSLEPRLRLRRFVIIVGVALATLAITLLTIYLIVTNWGGPRREPIASQPNLTVRSFVKWPDAETAIYPVGIARDAAGVLYVSSFGKGAIYKISADGKPTQWVGSTNGITAPAAIAFAPDGALYVVDFSNPDPAKGIGSLKRIAPDGSVTGVAATQSANNSLSFLSQLVFDGRGDLFISYANRGEVWRYPPGGAGAVWLIVPSGDGKQAQPTGLAYDAAANALYIGDDESGSLYRVPLKADGSADIPLRVYSEAGRTLPALALDEQGRILSAQWTKDNGYVRRLESDGKFTTLAENLRAPLSMIAQNGLIYVVNSDLPGLLRTSGGAKPPFTIDAIAAK